MKKTFITNLVLLVLLNLLVKPFWIFGIDRTVQNTVGAQNYGVYAALFSLSIILNIFLDFGVTNFNNRNIAQNHHLLKKYFSNIFVLKLVLGAIYFVLSLIIGFVIGLDAHKFYLFIFLLFNQFLLSFILYLRSNISGLHMFKTDSCISVVDRFILIVLCCLLLFHRFFKTNFCIEWFVYAQTISYLTTFFIALVIVLRQAGGLRLKFDFKFLVLIAKQSYPFALLTLLMSLYTRVDLVMLERMLPDSGEQAGIYAQSYRILDAVSMFAYLFAGLLLPMFSTMIKRNEDLTQMIRLSFSLIIVPAITFVVMSYFYGWELTKLMYHNHITESTEIYRVLIICFIPIASSYIFGTLLTANNSLKFLNISAIIGMILNVVLNIIVIPRYKAYGAAMASLITQILTAVIQILLARHIFRLPTNWNLIGRIVMFVIGTILIFAFGRGFLENWIYNMAILCFAAAILAFVLRLINVKAIYKILKYDKE